MTLFAITACMNEFDTPTFDEPPFGNNTIGKANTTIEKLKKEYASTISANGAVQITDDVIIEGVVVCNDESGNVYKQFVINDETGAIIIGVNDVGLYATMAVGQRVRIDCKGLYVGGYGNMAQIGTLYNGGIGRMSKNTFPDHVRLIGTPSSEGENQLPMTPIVVDNENFFTKERMSNLPLYVELKGVEFEEANGQTLFAPEEEQISATNTAVERNVYIGKQKVIFRLSTYADFAYDTIPRGKHDIVGVMTRYRDYWQFMLGSTNDIKPVEQ